MPPVYFLIKNRENNYLTMDPATASALNNPRALAEQIQKVMAGTEDPEELKDVVAGLASSRPDSTAASLVEYAHPTTSARVNEPDPATEKRPAGPATLGKGKTVDRPSTAPEPEPPEVRSVLSVPSSPVHEEAPSVGLPPSELVSESGPQDSTTEVEMLEIYLSERMKARLSELEVKMSSLMDEKCASLVTSLTRLQRDVEILKQRISVAKAPPALKVLTQPEPGPSILPQPADTATASTDAIQNKITVAIRAHRGAPPPFAKNLRINAILRELGSTTKVELSATERVPWEAGPLADFVLRNL